ncbi:E3 ubiquitin-protein ligase UPL5-like [Papaver somniferum]|uniref:E3 ubiquitin-protein ligase UPL5-like n=1 Tax=Papaver somniferum TaxID=3469 RepID=UPI000E6FF02D|nr:E3 ubiquitin-protein ligase UPL5-like [Papaver somniferum]
MFYVDFTSLLRKLDGCLKCLDVAVRDAGGNLKFNIGWSYFLSILKELNSISKLYEDGEELPSGAFRAFPLAIRYLICHSKRGDDHLWLLKYDTAIDFESRIHLMVLMFPEVKDDNRKLQKMLVDRSLLLTESFEHIGLVEARSLHNGLFVEFKNEAATGHGVLREWLFLVCQALFSSEYSLFVECPEDRRRFFPNPAQVKPQQLMLYAFGGRVIALALMDKVKVRIAFDRVFFLQLAEEKISMEDIRCADPMMYKSCKDILEMDADLVDAGDLGLTFVREIKEFGSRKTVELCPGGIGIVVNSKNREQYVHLLIQHIFVKSISAKVAYFARGFGDILCKRRLAKNFFRSIGLRGLDCVLDGSDKPICFKDWKAHVKYEDCNENDEQICWFWKVVEDMSMEQQRELLFFWTSVKYLPVVGFSGLSHPLTICKTSCSDDHLPSSHTCFYRLSLPHYPSLAITQQRLSLICQTHVGCSFGFG